MRQSVLAAMIVAATAGAALAQPTPTPPPGTRTRDESPQWVRRPTSADIEQYYPEAALRREASGDVLLRCKVTAAGSLEQCVVEKETPQGLGFGQAALKLQPSFEMAPKVNGHSVAGASVAIPIQFRIYDSAGAIALPVQGTPPAP